MVKFLVGFTNKGSQDFTVKSLEASFRYPQEFQFYVRNVRWLLRFTPVCYQNIHLRSIPFARRCDDVCVCVQEWRPSVSHGYFCV